MESDEGKTLSNKFEELMGTLTHQAEMLKQIGQDIKDLERRIDFQVEHLDQKIEHIFFRLSFKERMKVRKDKLLGRIPRTGLGEKRKEEPKSQERPAAVVISPPEPAKVEKMRKIESLPLAVTVVMNWECNYHCSYCFAQKPKDKSQYRKYKAVEWEKALSSWHSKYGRCLLTFTGGEPLMYGDAVELIIGLSKYHHVSVGTNLAVDQEALIAIAQGANLNNLFFACSFHLEHTSIRQFIDKWMVLKKYGVNSYANAVAYPAYLSEMAKIKKAAEENGIQIGFFPYIGKYKGRTFPAEYSNEENQVLRELQGWHKPLLSEDKKIELPKVKGALCYTGVKFIVIDPSGNIRRCWPVDKILGNIFDDDFSLGAKPTPCSQDVCNCIDYWQYIVN